MGAIMLHAIYFLHTNNVVDFFLHLLLHLRVSSHQQDHPIEGCAGSVRAGWNIPWRMKQ